MANALHAYLLDVDDELGELFDMRGRHAVRQLATARVLSVEVGPCELDPWFELARDGPGLLIVDGLLAFETHTGDRVAAELVGAGDLLQAPALATDELLARSCHWHALWPTRLGVLDGEFAERIQPFPQITKSLLGRACRRSAGLDVLRAISSQPRLEIRLVLLLWHLATRWGRVEPSSVRLSLPLTHRLLGHLVAAERPSISHALKRLAHAGLVTGGADDLHLHGSLNSQLQWLLERPGGTVTEQPASDQLRAG